MSVSEYLMSEDKDLLLQPEKVDPRFCSFNDSGVESEVGEMLYSLVRILKPKIVLEIGTNFGISASYIAKGLKDNDVWRSVVTKSHTPLEDIIGADTVQATSVLITYERIEEIANIAIKRFQTLGLCDWIDMRVEDASNCSLEEPVDMLWLDGECETRFEEFVRLFPYVNPGGVIGFHDLGIEFGQTGQFLHGRNHFPWGEIPEFISEVLVSGKAHIFQFRTSRGTTLVQKSFGEGYVEELLGEHTR